MAEHPPTSIEQVAALLKLAAVQPLLTPDGVNLAAATAVSPGSMPSTSNLALVEGLTVQCDATTGSAVKPVVFGVSGDWRTAEHNVGRYITYIGQPDGYSGRGCAAFCTNVGIIVNGQPVATAHGDAIAMPPTPVFGMVTIIPDVFAPSIGIGNPAASGGLQPFIAMFDLVNNANPLFKAEINGAGQVVCQGIVISTLEKPWQSGQTGKAFYIQMGGTGLDTAQIINFNYATSLWLPLLVQCSDFTVNNGTIDVFNIAPTTHLATFAGAISSGSSITATLAIKGTTGIFTGWNYPNAGPGAVIGYIGGSTYLDSIDTVTTNYKPLNVRAASIVLNIGNTPGLTVNADGTTTIASLAGTGSRTVHVDANGKLSAS